MENFFCHIKKEELYGKDYEENRSFDVDSCTDA